MNTYRVDRHESHLTDLAVYRLRKMGFSAFAEIDAGDHYITTDAERQSVLLAAGSGLFLASELAQLRQRGLPCEV